MQCWKGGDVVEIIVRYQELDKQPEEVRYRRSVQLDWLPDGALCGSFWAVPACQGQASTATGGVDKDFFSLDVRSQ